jgi:hypothetical protein
MKEDEIIKTFSIDRHDTELHLVGVVVNKHFIKFTKEASHLNELVMSKALTFDYHVTIVYSNP